MSNKEVEFSSLLEISRFAEEDGKNIVEGIATTADLDVDDLYISEEALIGAENDLRKYTTLLYNHDRDKEIGKILEVEYRPEHRALWIKALISKTVPDIWTKIKEGVLNKFSVSGTALDFTEKFIKGLDGGKVIQYVNQIRLFETSLVTVPADPSSRTLAFYVEKSLNKQFNKENSMSTKKKDVKKSKEDGIQRDPHQIETLISSVEDALSSEDKDIRNTALRSALDFFKAALELSSKSDGERGKEEIKGITMEDVTKSIDEVVTAKLDEIKETIEAFSKSTSEAAKVKAEDDVSKDKEEDKISKDKEEDKISKDKEDKKEDVSKAKENSEVADLKRSVSDLIEIVKHTLPIRKGVGSESHKEDDRKDTAEDKELARKKKLDKFENPADKLRAILDNAEEVSGDSDK